MWSAIHLHIDTEPAWTVAITAIQEVAELHTVGVIFTQSVQQQLSLLACAVLG